MSRNRYAFAQGNPVNYQDPSGHRVASDLAIALFIASCKGTSHFTTTIHRTDLNEVLQRNPDYYHHYSDNMVLDIYNEIVCILNGFELGLELKKVGDDMSRGIGVHANKILEDDKIVIYEYGAYNLNEPEFRNEAHVYDGYITVLKECFIEPGIHEKIKKMPGGRKKWVPKRIPISVNYGQFLQEGKIKVENCSCCWKRTDDELQVDVMACHVLFKLFYQYQEEGMIPSVISYNV